MLHRKNRSVSVAIERERRSRERRAGSLSHFDFLRARGCRDVRAVARRRGRMIGQSFSVPARHGRSRLTTGPPGGKGNCVGMRGIFPSPSLSPFAPKREQKCFLPPYFHSPPTVEAINRGHRSNTAAPLMIMAPRAKVAANISASHPQTI